MIADRQLSRIVALPPVHHLYHQLVSSVGYPLTSSIIGERLLVARLSARDSFGVKRSASEGMEGEGE